MAKYKSRGKSILDLAAYTNGAAVASKVVVLDENLDYDFGLGDIDATIITADTRIVPDAASGADLGSAALEWGDVYIGDDKKLYFGDGQDVSIEYDEDGLNVMLVAGDVTFADGTTDVDVAAHDGTNGLKLGGTLVTSTAAELNILDGVTADFGELNILDGVTATAVEINRAADKSTSVVNETSATLSLTAALHASRIVTLNRAAGVTVTLPAATGTGEKYTIVIGTTATSNANVIKVDNATDVMDGSLNIQQDTDADGTLACWMAEVGDDTMTFAGAATTGGIVGNRIECIDYAAGFWSCTAWTISGGGGEATPFSATVA